jgi:LmbE family N-acetylglucosaminyl deacetylase
VAAHPDDETLGLGAHLSQLERFTLVHITDGAPRDMQDAHREGFETRRAYAAARRRELGDALSMLSAAPDSIVTYGWPDKESVRYLTHIARSLSRDLAPARYVFTHAFEHGHPDHDAASLAVHAACAILRRERGSAPVIIEFPSYHVRGNELVLGAFWSDPNCPECVLTLKPHERASKSRALSCFVTQRSILDQFPLGEERFRVAPLYDFSQPAPPVVAFYDRLGWPMTSCRWRLHATAGLYELGLNAVL